MYWHHVGTCSYVYCVFVATFCKFMELNTSRSTASYFLPSKCRNSRARCQDRFLGSELSRHPQKLLALFHPSIGPILGTDLYSRLHLGSVVKLVFRQNSAVVKMPSWDNKAVPQMAISSSWQLQKASMEFGGKEFKRNLKSTWCLNYL